MDRFLRLSEALYGALCLEMGTDTQVRTRREVQDTFSAVNETLWARKCESACTLIVSGSHREGFRFATSDIDFMLCYFDHKVITDFSQISLYRTPQQTVILMECEDQPSGFTKLKLITPSRNPSVRSSCEVVNGEICISSTLFRRCHFGRIHNIYAYTPSLFEHGPCTTAPALNKKGKEADIAFCLKSHHWPEAANSWIARCQRSGWPSSNLTSEIVKSGFHVVPIGSSSDKNMEWRISFSEAEKQLVYSFNHCQFLCYGLLKIFLREVINAGTETPVLCSYFLKTVLFWVIQNDNTLIWSPANLLCCFWKCFELMIHWVNSGNCPNFFIPENNMFRSKLTGPVQSTLCSQLCNIYFQGISCLLFSPTIRPYLLPRTEPVCDERSLNMMLISDIYFYNEILITGLSSDFEGSVVYLNKIGSMLRKSLTYHKKATLQHLTCKLLRNAAMCVQNTNDYCVSCNRNLYMTKNACSLFLKISAKFGFASDILYLAMYYYRNCRFQQSLSCLYKAQHKMSAPFIIYTGGHDPLKVFKPYERYMAGVPLSERMRKVVSTDIILEGNYTYIDELVLKEESTALYESGELYIPPLVMLHLLFVLNHHKLGDTVRAQQSVQDLHMLLLYDDGAHIPTYLRHKSWHILGICQQTCGDSTGALSSFENSRLEQETRRHSDFAFKISRK